MKHIFSKLLPASLFALSMITTTCYAQDSLENKSLTFSGYAEAYYTYEFNQPIDNTAPGFVYSHNRTNEVNINLAFIKAAYSTNTIRANIALAAGSYMNANYSLEKGVFKNVYEVNIGMKLSRKHNLWLDAGILPSHIGFESAIGKDNWTLTRSLVADNSPYFETGAKLSYTTPKGNWYLATLYLNGWQRIERADGNTTPAFGAQLVYKPSGKLSLNYSAFAGNDKPDSLRQMRYFHNLYAIYQVNKRIGITAGFDFGMEQELKGSSRFNEWYAPVLIARYNIASKINMAARFEYYQDREQVIVVTGKPVGFETIGLSANIDYSIASNVIWRLEAKNYNAKGGIFTKRTSELVDHSTSISTALSIYF